MQGRAIQKSVRQSPRKMRLVVDLIRGRDVNEAYAILSFSKKHAAKQIAKTLKRFTAAAQGRGTPIRKRTSHVEITVAMREDA